MVTTVFKTLCEIGRRLMLAVSLVFAFAATGSPATQSDVAKVQLDPARGGSLEALTVGGMSFERANDPRDEFPVFTCLDLDRGRFDIAGSDARWNVRHEKDTVTYSSTNGLSITVSYRMTPQGTMRVATRVNAEGRWRLVSVRGALRVKESNDISFLSCVDGGRLYHGGWTELCFGKTGANFLGVVGERCGVLLHPLHHAWMMAFGSRRGETVMSLRQDFRPSNVTAFVTLLCHTELAFELQPYHDENGDGVTNWVDAGICYRNCWIKKAPRIDTRLRDGLCGKIRWGESKEAFKASMQSLRADVPDVPILMWVLAPTGGANTRHLPSEKTSQEWREVKTELEPYGIFISPHDNLDDVSAVDALSDPLRIHWTSQMTLMHAWDKTFRQSLWDADFIRGQIDTRLAKWSAKPGDTWHIDVFAHPPFEDYNPSHPSTRETNYQDRRRWLGYYHDTHRLGITSEFFLEGYHEVCDYGWWSIFWSPTGPNEQRVPLLPVLFQGRAYYGVYDPLEKTWVKREDGHPSVEESLVWGVKFHTQRLENFKRIYEQNVLWQLNADKTVKNMIFTDDKWKPVYEVSSR